jgi:putative membrane protein
LEIDILFFIGGVLLGLMSGLVPGVHSNTVAAVLSSLGMAPDRLASAIIGLFPAHALAAFIPSIFFGVPESGTVISVLAGQRLVMEGKGVAALKAVVLSCAFAALLGAALFQPSLAFYSVAYAALHDYMKWILLALTVALAARSKRPMLSTLVLLLSGLLGQYALGSPMEDPFLPLFSGLFAMGAMLNYAKGAVPAQEDGPVERGIAKWSALGVALGMAAHLLPGVGSPSQIATLATIFLPLGTVAFLATISAISVSEGIFSLSTTAAIGKSRMGTVQVLSQYADVGHNLVPFLVLVLVSIAIAGAVIYALRNVIGKAANIDFSHANAILAAYLFLIVALIDGAGGVAVFILASAIGWLTIRLGAERTNMMGAIIVPTLLTLFGVFV